LLFLTSNGFCCFRSDEKTRDVGCHKRAQPCCLKDRREDKISDMTMSGFERERNPIISKREIEREKSASHEDFERFVKISR